MLVVLLLLFSLPCCECSPTAKGAVEAVGSSLLLAASAIVGVGATLIRKQVARQPV